jgi:ferredoxin-NADP reductase
MRDPCRALLDKPPVDPQGVRGRYAVARFKHRRRMLEGHLFVCGPVTMWKYVKDQNTKMGVWG